MRIVGGIFKGRNLATFSGEDIRPTSDMVRESIFNILQTKILEATFLDLFCGTGAMGIEALSRGAKEVVFNDFSKDSIAVTKKNLEKIGNPKTAIVNSGDAISYLKRTDKKFDFVFIDPPYKTDLGYIALENIKDVLSSNGVAIYENEKPFDREIKGLKIVDQRKYGRAFLTFFIKEEE